MGLDDVRSFETPQQITFCPISQAVQMKIWYENKSVVC